MRLNPPKKLTFYISIAAAVIGFVLYALHTAGVLEAAWLGLAGVLVLTAAFVLLTLGLVLKGL